MKKLHFFRCTLFMLFSLVTAGCTSVPDRDTISPTNVKNIRQNRPRSEMEQINFISLRQDPPEQYVLGPRDTLAIHIDRVTTTRPEDPVPILNPPEGSGLPPAVGVPFTIADDGTLRLPLILGPMYVEGLTLTELENEIRKAYTEVQKILPPNARIMVSIYKPRTYRVMVIREDVRPLDMRTGSSGSNRGRGEAFIGNEDRGTAKSLQLIAYQNDVLQALCETGGLPSSGAKNEVIVLRGQNSDARGTNALISRYMSGTLQQEDQANIVRIPLRARPGETLPEFTQDDIILRDGDVVVIQSREAEVFYTGGLLQGGMQPIPRDFDLDVLGAISMAGGSVAAAAGGTSTIRGTGVGTLIPPTRLLVIREINGYQRAINIDMKQAMIDPSQRILIQPNDLIILEYRPNEVAMNLFLSTFSLRLDLQSLWD